MIPQIIDFILELQVVLGVMQPLQPDKNEYRPISSFCGYN